MAFRMSFVTYASPHVVGAYSFATLGTVTKPPLTATAAEYLSWMGSRGGKARRRNTTAEQRRATSSKAGKARAKRLTPARRRAIARNAALARWKKKSK
jgi:hypothetical protein